MIALEVLRLWDTHELEIDSFLYFDWSKGTDNVQVSVNVSDRFYWATADAEPVVTQSDVDLLSTIIDECKLFTDFPEANVVTVVYAARKRGVQPMPRYCKEMIGLLTKDLPANTDWDWGRELTLERKSGRLQP